MDELNNLRREIDQIDRQLVELFCRRMDATRRVGQVKAAAGIPVLDQDREREVLMSRGNLAGEELRPAVITLYQTIMTLSRRQQQEGMAFNKLVRDKIPAIIEALKRLDFQQEEALMSSLPNGGHSGSGVRAGGGGRVFQRGAAGGLSGKE